MRTALFALVLALATPAAASEEQYTPWSDVSLTTSVPAPYGTVRVAMKGEGGRLQSVRIERDGKPAIDVPANAFSDVTGLDLSQVQTTFEVGYDPVPWFYVKVRYGAAVQTTRGYEWPQLVIAVQGDKVVYRALKTPKADGNSDWQQTKL